MRSKRQLICEDVLKGLPVKLNLGEVFIVVLNWGTERGLAIAVPLRFRIETVQRIARVVSTVPKRIHCGFVHFFPFRLSSRKRIPASF
ncbi:hypothetical protein TNCT_345091 [Trichonephila clavata]|uniref:Uncharacterized protein n=1 Tax=Trichonephila clavata TaxID=2740835 RepID=A0A8X6M1A4_TRICU|nr:hypothetical protein TNCT_345091 [Trichonephila clavata]